MRRNEPPSWTLFISHASADKPVARRVRDALVERHVAVWLDEAEIRVGDSIPQAVQAGLEGSDALALLVSEASTRSKWVGREFNSFIVTSIQNGRPIFPCRLDDSQLPGLIADIKYADFRGSVEDGISQLLGARHLVEESAMATEAQDAATRFFATLSGDALALATRILREGSYYVGDRRTERHPYQLLAALRSLGLADYEPDRYEQAWEITPLGSRVLPIIDSGHRPG